MKTKNILGYSCEYYPDEAGDIDEDELDDFLESYIDTHIQASRYNVKERKHSIVWVTLENGYVDTGNSEHYEIVFPTKGIDAPDIKESPRLAIEHAIKNAKEEIELYKAKVAFLEKAMARLDKPAPDRQ